MTNTIAPKNPAENLLFKSNRYAVTSKGHGRTLHIDQKAGNFPKCPSLGEPGSTVFRPAASFVLENEFAKDVALDIQIALTQGVHPTLLNNLLDNFLGSPRSLY